MFTAHCRKPQLVAVIGSRELVCHNIDTIMGGGRDRAEVVGLEWQAQHLHCIETSICCFCPHGGPRGQRRPA